MRHLVSNYYLNFRCNDTCEFCPIWADESLQGIEESPFEAIAKNLKDLKALGVVYVDFTGGEPLLYDDLPKVLSCAKELNLFTVLTTNGILYRERADEIKGLVNRLIFSMDFPVAEEHDRSRGGEIFSKLIAAVKYARKIGEFPFINYTVTRDSINMLPEARELCENLESFLWINPVKDFFGTQGFSGNSLDYLLYMGRRRNAGINQAMVRLMSKFGNQPRMPRCRAASSVITIFPDDTLVAPCFYNRSASIKIEGRLKNILRKSKDYKQAANLQGKSEICRNCMSSAYMIPSFLYRLDDYFLLNLRSFGQLFWKEFQYRRNLSKKK